MRLVVVPLACELLFVGTLYGLLKEVELERQKEAQAQAIAAHMNKLLRAVIYAGALTSGAAMSRKDTRALRGADPIDEAPQEFKIIRELSKDNPDQMKRVDELESLVYQGVEDLQEIKNLTKHGDPFSAIADARHFSLLMAKIGAKIEVVIQDAEVIEKDTTRSQEKTRQFVWIVLVIGVIVNVVLAVGLALHFNRSTTQRLQVLLDNTMRLASGKPLTPSISGDDDEIAYLDKVFRDTAKSLADSEATKRELTAMITHDLRSPLAAVQAVLELLAMGVYGQQSSDAVLHLNMAEDNVNRVLRLINDLLDVEKMRAGKLTIEPAPMLISDAINKSVDAVRSLAEQKQLQIDVVLPDPAPTVNADAGRIAQVMINLLTNAIKYSPDKSTVRVVVTELEREQTQVSVIDTGCGIAPEMQQTIFEKFEQTQNAVVTQVGQTKGSGLGLAICKAIVEQHNGQIGVRSEVGNGSMFWFTLPQLKAIVASGKIVEGAVDTAPSIHTP